MEVMVLSDDKEAKREKETHPAMRKNPKLPQGVAANISQNLDAREHPAHQRQQHTSSA
jgi:hypothetical protein